jgi:hypothetical protein
VGVSALEYKPEPAAHVVRGPYNDPNIGSSDFSYDSMAAYSHALQWWITGKEVHADKAIEILNSWSSTLETISGHDARLLIGMGGIGFCNAAELIRHSDASWRREDQDRFAKMLRTIFYPEIKDFHPTANGNWDASMIQTMLAMGVYLDDRVMFDRAVEYFLHGQGNGAIENYFNEFASARKAVEIKLTLKWGLGFSAVPARSLGSRALIFTLRLTTVWPLVTSTRRNTILVRMCGTSPSEASKVDTTTKNSLRIRAGVSRQSMNVSFTTTMIEPDWRCRTVAR